MSTKGMSVTAARQLVEELSKKGVTILIIHDFDMYGFRIAYTLGHDTDRYRFKNPPKVIDMGLRLEDALEMGLDSEEYDASENDADALLKYGATEEEIEFLTKKRKVKVLDEDGNPILDEYDKPVEKTILPSRIELNAMDSQQFIDWLEDCLKKHGVKKVIPDKPALETVWEKQWRERVLQSSLNQAVRKLGKPPTMPKGMIQRIKNELAKDPTQDWCDALSIIATDRVNSLPAWRMIRAARDPAKWLPNLKRHKPRV